MTGAVQWRHLAMCQCVVRGSKMKMQLFYIFPGKCKLLSYKVAEFV